MNGERTNDRDGELGDEMFFTAIRYALDELSPLARDAFEQRLLVDQHAREYLAEAVAVCQCAYDGMQARIEPVTAARSQAISAWVVDLWTNPPTTRRPVVWACLALAASLLLAVGISLFNPHGETPLADTKPDDAGRQLAVAWVTSGEWVVADGGRLGVAGHERRVPADDQSRDDQSRNDDVEANDLSAAEIGEADEGLAWLEAGAEPSSAEAANDWLFEAVTMPESPAVGHREG